MTEEAAIEMLKLAARNVDTECAHVDADSVLCKFLEELGYRKVVEAYAMVDKWYA